jgi:DNA-directed RNA polymerase specialized sigma24 family protein
MTDDAIIYGPDGQRIHEEFSKIAGAGDRRARAHAARLRIGKAIREIDKPSSAQKLLSLLTTSEKNLSPLAKQIFVQKAHDKKPFPEIANALGLSQDDVRREFYSAYNILTSHFPRTSDR